MVNVVCNYTTGYDGWRREGLLLYLLKINYPFPFIPLSSTPFNSVTLIVMAQCSDTSASMKFPEHDSFLTLKRVPVV